MCNIFENFEKGIDHKNEKGVFLIELAIALPLVLFISFIGFELTRRMMADLVIKDIARELAVSGYLCSFQDDDAREDCYDRVFNAIERIASVQFPPRPDGTTSRISMSLESYMIDQGDPDAFDSTNLRSSACGLGGNENLVMALNLIQIGQRVTGGIDGPGYPNKYSMPINSRTIGNLVARIDRAGRRFDVARSICLNNSVTIAEVRILYQPVLGFSINLFTGDDSNDMDEVTMTTEVFL